MNNETMNNDTKTTRQIVLESGYMVSGMVSDKKLDERWRRADASISKSEFRKVIMGCEHHTFPGRQGEFIEVGELMRLVREEGRR